MKILDAINEQMNFELESAYIYRSMAAYLNSMEMLGMEHFMAHQEKEEIEHADRMKAFLQDVGYEVKYRAINPGEGSFSGILDVFEKAYAHEKVVTENIHKLVRLAREEGDLRAEGMLQWFVKEQVEEEANFSSLVTKLERAKDSWSGLTIIDGQMGQR